MSLNTSMILLSAVSALMLSGCSTTQNACLQPLPELLAMPTQLSPDPETTTSMTQMVLQRGEDIKQTSLKDNQLIQLQEWGIHNCGWKRPD